ncbi:GIN domain-containing protein [Luteimonas qiangzhengi]
MKSVSDPMKTIRSIPMRHRCLLLCALLLPVAAHATDAHCSHSAPRQLQLDMDGVRTVKFEVAGNKLRLDAAASADGALQGRACASSAGALEHLKLEQQRDGDQLTVRLYREGRLGGLFSSRGHAYLDLSGSVPDDVLVQLSVGSGDAWVTGASAVSADVGSGDIDARGIAGLVTAKVGSGDITLHDIGALNVLSIGSGDIEASQVRGSVEVGSIGSGDLELEGVAGDAQIGSIGSGDADLRDVRGSVTVGSIGSGDLDVRGVGADLTVRSVGSGSVRHTGVGGSVDVPRRR